MKFLRSVEINKYKPAVFKARPFNEWMSCLQIAEGKLTKDDYLLIEGRYLSAINRIAAGRPLRAKHIECWDDNAEVLEQIGLDDVLTDTSSPKEDELVEAHTLENVIRRCLRESAWMELGIPSELMIHFGHDLRLIVVSSEDLTDISKEIRQRDQLYVYKSNANLDTMGSWSL